jgi:hypothetical protein
MAEIALSERTRPRLEKLSAQEARSVDALVQALLDEYERSRETNAEATPGPDPLRGLIGLLDEFTEATDLSSTVRDTLKAHTHPEYGWTKRDRTD